MLIAFRCRHCRHLTVITQERFAVCLFYANSLIVQRGRISDNESGTAGTATVNLLPSLKGNPPLRDGFYFTSFQGLQGNSPQCQAPPQRLRHAICVAKMLGNTQSIACAFRLADGIPRSLFRHFALCVVASQL